MDGLKARALSVAVVSVVLAGVVAGPALGPPGVTGGSLSSLHAGARAGTPRGEVANAGAHAANARVSVRIQRTGAPAKFVGRTALRVPADGTASYRVAVKVPSGLSRGNYYFAACTALGSAGDLSCATSAKEILIKGGTPVRGSAVRLPTALPHARAAQAETCASGAHTLAAPGERVYPELGNGGYASLHSDVFINYDALTNLFLPGTHVDLQQRSTQCLTDFSLDFNTRNSASTGNNPGPDLTVGSITINGRPATFKFVHPTYPGDPNGQDDPDPLAHRSGLTTPINADNPNPPACAPINTRPENQNIPCDPLKLVITPSAPVPSGTDFTV